MRIRKYKEGFFVVGLIDENFRCLNLNRALNEKAIFFFFFLFSLFFEQRVSDGNNIFSLFLNQFIFLHLFIPLNFPLILETLFVYP